MENLNKLLTAGLISRKDILSKAIELMSEKLSGDIPNGTAENGSRSLYKKCRISGDVLPLEDFVRHKNQKDGRRNSCRKAENFKRARKMTAQQCAEYLLTSEGREDYEGYSYIRKPRGGDYGI